MTLDKKNSKMLKTLCRFRLRKITLQRDDFLSQTYKDKLQRAIAKRNRLHEFLKKIIDLLASDR